MTPTKIDLNAKIVLKSQFWFGNAINYHEPCCQKNKWDILFYHPEQDPVYEWYQHVWLLRKTRRRSLGLVLSNGQKHV
jgi:hypothetical protein